MNRTSPHAPKLLAMTALLLIAMTAIEASAQTSSDNSPGAPSGGIQACVDTRTTVDLDTVTAAGVSARQLLETVEGDFEIVVDWRDTSGLDAVHQRAGTTSAALLRVAHDGQELVFVESKGGGCPKNDLMGAPCVVCKSRFEIGISLELDTDDGSFKSDRFAGTLTSMGAGGRIAASIPLSEVGGSYLDDIRAKTGRDGVEISIVAAFGSGVPGSKATDKDGWNGFVALRLEGKAGSPVLAAHGYWPAK